MKSEKCIICDSEFMPKHSKHIYCSKYCKSKRDMNKRNKKTGNKTCLHCLKEFSPYTSLDKFCSMECRIEHQKSKRSFNWSKEKAEKRIGKNNPSYRNGNFVRGVKRTAIGERKFMKNRTELKDKMINDKGYIYCEHCGISGNMKFESHHIVFRSEKPLHKNLHDKVNIIILCISCHNVYHKNKGIRNSIVENRNLNELFGNDVLNKNFTIKI